MAIIASQGQWRGLETQPMYDGQLLPTDGVASNSESHCLRVLGEVLGCCEVFTASEGGPNGPWYYRTLTVKRRMNTIYVRGPDEMIQEKIPVDEIDSVPHMAYNLKARLDAINTDVLEDL